MYNSFCVWIHVLNSLGYQGVELLDHIKIILCLNFLKSIQTAFQNECTILHCHQQCRIKFYIPILDQILCTIKCFIFLYVCSDLGFPGDLSGKEPTCQCRRHEMCVKIWSSESTWLSSCQRNVRPIFEMKRRPRAFSRFSTGISIPALHTRSSVPFPQIPQSPFLFSRSDQCWTISIKIWRSLGDLNHPSIPTQRFWMKTSWNFGAGRNWI